MYYMRETMWAQNSAAIIVALYLKLLTLVEWSSQAFAEEHVSLLGITKAGGLSC